VSRLRTASSIVACIAACVGALSACSSSPKHTTPTALSTPSATPSVTTPTVWLCRPGQRPDPCATDLTTTVVTATGQRHVQRPRAARDTGLDCFYVYPTVSKETGTNADLIVQRPERNAAIAQAAPFSPVCRVWAPMYRQRTTGDLFNLADGAANSLPNRVAFASVEAAWRDYLAHDNDGRRVVLIGHSQGAAMLIRLIRADIDPSPAARAKLALALLLGGNVTVADGGQVGGSFQHVPLCTHPRQSACVIAYSSFPSEPPAFALFGRAGAGVSLLSGETATNRQVACVNPAAIGGGAAPLHTAFATATFRVRGVDTPWVSTPGRFIAQCKHVANVTWLQVTAAPHDVRPKLSETLGSAWGYHVADVNLAIGDLVADVAAVGQ